MDKVYYEQNVYALNILQNKQVWKLFKECHKGGEKVRPYLEVKVVKVEKEKKENTNCNAEFICPICNKVLHHKDEVEKKGNWVNGECIDKIKFPCFCSFKYIYAPFRQYGELDKVRSNGLEYYRLRELKQVDGSLVIGHEEYRLELEELIRTYNIHILKGKIILFEEE